MNGIAALTLIAFVALGWWLVFEAIGWRLDRFFDRLDRSEETR